MTVHQLVIDEIPIPLLGPLDAEEQAMVRKGATRRRTAAGQTIMWEGDPQSAFHVLLSGRARAVLQRRDGGEIRLRYLEAGDGFGELGLCGCTESPYMVVAVRDCELMVVPLPLLAALLCRKTSRWQALFSDVGRQLRQAQGRLRILSADRGERRVLELLRELATQIGVPMAEGVLISEKVSHQSLADSTGLTRETVTRLIGRLRREGLLRSRRDGILLSARLLDEVPEADHTPPEGPGLTTAGGTSRR